MNEDKLIRTHCQEEYKYIFYKNTRDLEEIQPGIF